MGRHAAKLEDLRTIVVIRRLQLRQAERRAFDRRVALDEAATALREATTQSRDAVAGWQRSGNVSGGLDINMQTLWVIEMKNCRRVEADCIGAVSVAKLDFEAAQAEWRQSISLEKSISSDCFKMARRCRMQQAEKAEADLSFTHLQRMGLK